MSDIVERLRQFATQYRERSPRCRNVNVAKCLDEAADEIERLRDAIELLYDRRTMQDLQRLADACERGVHWK